MKIFTFIILAKMVWLIGLLAQEDFRSIDDWRLLNTTYPTHYQLHFTIQSDENVKQFDGNCTIDITVGEDTKDLLLHAEGLKIYSLELRDPSTNANIQNIQYAIHDGYLHIYRDKKVLGKSKKLFKERRKLKLYVLYNGPFNEKERVGLFRFENGIAGLMEPTYPRTLFPCYDEPAYKATYTLILTFSNNYAALSNMPQAAEAITGENNMITVQFRETTPISTHTIGFIISQRAVVTLKYNGIVLRTFANRLKINMSAQLPALRNLLVALKSFEDILNVPYPWPKMDYFVSDHEFTSRGLTSGLMVDESELVSSFHSDGGYKNIKALQRQKLEIALQWFGNLVSPAWWSDLWLFDTLASYYSILLIDEVYSAFPASNLLSTLFCYSHLEEYRRTSAISKDEFFDKDIRTKLGSSDFKKAICQLQMFDHAFGAEIFRKGVTNFVKQHANGSASVADFHDSLQATAIACYAAKYKYWHYSISDIMQSWWHQGSYPIVTIKRNYLNNTLQIEQKAANGNDQELWWIPMKFSTASQPDFESTAFDIIIPPQHTNIVNLTALGIKFNDDDWVIVNNQGKIFYNIIYDDENLRRIGYALQTNFSAINHLNRLSIVQQIYIAITNQITNSFDVIIDVLSYLPNEDDQYVAYAAKPVLNKIFCLLQHRKMRKWYKIFMSDVINSFEYIRMSDTNWNYQNTAHDIEFGIIGNPLEMLQAKQDVLLLISRNVSVEKWETVNFKMCDIARTLNDAEFKLILDYFMKTTDKHYWYGLKCTKSASQYAMLLQMVYDLESHTFQVYNKIDFIVTSMISVYTTNRALTWRMLENNFANKIHKLKSQPWNIKYMLYLQLQAAFLHVPAEHMNKFMNIVAIYDKVFPPKYYEHSLQETIMHIKDNEGTQIAFGARDWFRNKLLSQ